MFRGTCLALAAFATASCTSVASEALQPVPLAQPVAKSPQRLVDTGGPLRFAIVSDRTGGHRPEVFEAAMGKLNLMQPDLVMSVGDFIEGYTEDVGQLESEWSEIEDAVAKLEMPLFYAPGNHDIGNPVMAEFWQSRRGPSYYAFTFKECLFLVLDTENPPIEFDEQLLSQTKAMEAAMARDPEGTQARILEAVKGREDTPKPEKPAHFSAEQLAFVAETLASNDDVRWTFVFMHKPAWQLDSKGFAQIENQLSQRDYTVFAGHEHYYTYEARNGRDYLDLGTTGGVWLKDGPGRVDHVTWVTMADKGPVIANLELSGIFSKEGPEGR